MAYCIKMPYSIGIIAPVGYSIDNTQYMGIRIPYDFCGDNPGVLHGGIWSYPLGLQRPHSSLDVTAIRSDAPLYPTADELGIDQASIRRMDELDIISRRDGWYFYPEYAPLREERFAIQVRWAYLKRRWVAWRRRRQAIAIWERMNAD